MIIDATCLRRGQRERLSSLGAACAAIVHVVYCHAPGEVLEAGGWLKEVGCSYERQPVCKCCCCSQR